MTPELPVKYVLYSHFGYSEGPDFIEWQKGEQQGKSCSELTGVKYLSTHLPKLFELLSSAAYEGILVLYYAPGVLKCLQAIAAAGAGGVTRQQLCAAYPELRFADAVQQYVDLSLKKEFGDQRYRLRFVTSLDLIEIFGRLHLNTQLRSNLALWLLGDVAQIRYDAPKILEAIVRLRLLGTGIPVFRLDHDVLFRGDEGSFGNNKTPDLGMFKAIESCRRAFLLRRDESRIATFLFSASYDTSPVLNSDSRHGLNAFDSWSGAFATRVFPAIPVRKEKIEDAVAAKDYTGAADWAWYIHEVFDEVLVRKFYGLKETGLTNDGVCGIGKIGAHPLVSVISGAMLCLSEGAIIDLPPFSNFRLNVSWIDDHLKYCLHRELRHLTTIELKIEPLLSDAKLDTVSVAKKRPFIQDLPLYILGTYLPTVLWGAVMDAWITPDPLLKYRPEDLPKEMRADWRNLPRSGRSGAILTRGLQDALAAQGILSGQKTNLVTALEAAALKRITEVRQEWQKLHRDGLETFASIWAKGTVDYYKEFVNLPSKCLGITRKGHPLDAPITNIGQLNPELIGELRTLTEDAVEYIEWTLNWPKIVQVVRSVEPGTVRFDMSWSG